MANVEGQPEAYLKALPQYLPGLSAISHEQKRLQFAGSRYLVHQLLNQPMAEVVNLLSGKPALLNHPAHISISHCRLKVAAIFSQQFSVGIDVEKIDPRVLKIKHKFLNTEELERCSGTNEMALCILHWCIKEAVYKWWQHYGVEFKTQIIITRLEADTATVQTHWSPSQYDSLQVHYKLLDDHYVAWLYK